MHETVIYFLVESGTIEPIAHPEYVRLVRGEHPAPQYAGQQVRVADWYMRVDGLGEYHLENETYSFLGFDKNGFAVMPGKAEDKNDIASPAWQPTSEERVRLKQMAVSGKQR